MTTPHLDQLAEEGILFNNCFCTNAICAPSRAVVLTGKYSHINGVRDNQQSFDGSQVTFPKLLQEGGYRTALIGKWHLGGTADYHPMRRGFDEFYGIPNTTDETLYVPTSTESKAPLPDGFLVPQIIQARAGGQLENVKPYSIDTRRTIDVELADMSVKYIQARVEKETGRKPSQAEVRKVLKGIDPNQDQTLTADEVTRVLKKGRRKR